MADVTDDDGYWDCECGRKEPTRVRDEVVVLGRARFRAGEKCVTCGRMVMVFKESE